MVDRRHGFTFNEDEIEWFDQFIATILRGGDPTVLLRSKTGILFRSKFYRARLRIKGGCTTCDDQGSTARDGCVRCGRRPARPRVPPARRR